jgi:hypothetical protein
VAKETEDDGKYEHDRAGDVRSAAGIPGLMLNDRDQQGKDGSRDQHAAGIDANTADPLFKVIAVCPENKPLISEERKRDGEKICQQARENVSVSEERCQQQREQGKAAVAKGCIERTDRQVAKQRRGHRRRRRSRIHDREWRQHQRETHRRASVCRGLTPPNHSPTGQRSEGYDRYHVRGARFPARVVWERCLRPGESRRQPLSASPRCFRSLGRCGRRDR